MLNVLVALLAAAELLGSCAAVLPQGKIRRPRQSGGYEPYINVTNSNNTRVSLNINTQDVSARNATAPYLYGIMFEDINHSGDGGIYGELLTNRAFQGSTVQFGAYPGVSGSSIISSENPIVPFGPVLTGWGAVGDVRITLDRLHPLSAALPVCMEVDIPDDATGEVGFVNYGWWGIDVRPQTYTASFYVLANEPRDGTTNTTDFKLSIQSNTTGEVWASTTVNSVLVSTLNWTQINVTIPNTVMAPNSNNSFTITMDASQVAGKTFYFNLISLFPETFKGRPNGLRQDIAQAFYDLKPSFLRFPGGNNLEGISVDTRWNWRETIGPLKDRPGRPGDWSYINTNGLGLLEYLEWCEDMEIEPVLAVYAGFSLDVWGQSGTSWPENQMDWIVQDALDELEYCMGDTSTTYGALRASHGHPEPFQINFVEVGNEDWFSNTYYYRWPALYNGIKAKYPNITLISTEYNENPLFNTTLPPGSMWDTHHYERPFYFLDNFNFYDNWQVATNNTDVGVLLGEYSVFQIDSPGAVNFSDPENLHVYYPRLLSALAEGTYALGGERNPNTVKMSSYAPSLQNLNWYNWTPNMIQFTANHNQTVLSVSYWQQWMFAHYRGTQTLPVTNTQGDFNPLFWGSTIDTDANCIYLKVINTGNQTVTLTVNIDTAWTSVNGTILTNPSLNAFNFVNNQTAVVPAPADLSAAGAQAGNGSWTWGVPQWSITVLQFDL